MARKFHSIMRKKSWCLYVGVVVKEKVLFYRMSAFTTVKGFKPDDLE